MSCAALELQEQVCGTPAVSDASNVHHSLQAVLSSMRKLLLPRQPYCPVAAKLLAASAVSMTHAL